MPQAINHLFKFGEFCLNTREKILLRSNIPVALTPKVLELLALFVEKHGRLIEKEEIMQQIWADSFVEESNLTFTIRQLRKILNDDAQTPTYIETVRGHGYRFIAKVEVISEDLLPKSFSEESIKETENSEISEESKQKSKIISKHSANNSFWKSLTVYAALATLLILLITTFLTAFFYNNKGSRHSSSAPILNTEFNSEQLTSSGTVYEAVISPDGKLMAYLNNIGGKASVWIRRIENGENIQIIPKSDDAYYGLAFSKDNQEIYFSRGPKTDEARKISIYRMSVFGGIPKEVVSGIESLFSLSPDNRQISFVRCPREDQNFCTLFVAETDGKNERALLTRPRPIMIKDNQFSPDGKSIAAAVGQSRNSSSEYSLIEVDVENKTEREITNHKFSSIYYLQWLPDKSALLLSAFEPPLNSAKLFRVSTESNEVQVLTNDSSVSYDCISLDQEAKKMVTTQTTANFQLWTASIDQPNTAVPISLATEPMYVGQSTFSFAPSSKKIVYASSADVNQQIWMMNADGTGQHQLTTGQGTNWQPRLSPDETYIVFASNRSGSGQIWRMNADGSNQTQLTNESGGNRPLFISSDGKTIYYESARDSVLGKMSIDANGQSTSTIISNERMFQPEISRDEKTVAYFSRKPRQPFQIELMSLANGEILQTFPLAEEKSIPLNIEWSSDGKSLYYLSKNDKQHTIWRLSIETGKSEIFANLTTEDISDFALSPDGKSFAFVRGKVIYDAFLITGLK